MPDSRTHRGPDPRDAEAFGPSVLPRLRAAVADLSWLLSRDYAPDSALKLVGDRWSLTERQRQAVRRSSCSDAALARRSLHLADPAELRGHLLVIDGFNVLTTVEAALGGAVVLLGRDGSCRDLMGVHGSYRKVEETLPALQLVGDFLAALGVGTASWLLDSPVSNSGRLKGLILQTAAAQRWEWRVEVCLDPDPLLIQSTATIATADSAVLDRCARWFGLARGTIESRIPGAWVVDLSCDSAPTTLPTIKAFEINH